MDPRLINAFLVAIAVEILFPLVLGMWIGRRFRAPWRLFGYGALIFLIFQLLTRVPAITALQAYLQDRWLNSPARLAAWIGFVALTAGLFEEGGRYLGYRFLWKASDRKDWAGALMYGAGHGGLESMLFVGGASILSLIQILTLLQGDLSRWNLSPEQLEAVRQAQQTVAAMAWWTPLVGALERIFAMAIQISLSVLVLQVFIRQEGKWWWIAVAYHTAIDAIAPLVAQYASVWLGEAIVGAFALLSIGIILWLRPPCEPRGIVPAT